MLYPEDKGIQAAKEALINVNSSLLEGNERSLNEAKVYGTIEQVAFHSEIDHWLRIFIEQLKEKDGTNNRLE